MANFSTPSIDSLITRARADFHAARASGQAWLEKNIERGLIGMAAGLGKGIYGKIRRVGRDAIPGPDNSEEAALAWASVILPTDEQRKPAVNAILTLSWAPAPDGLIMPEGSTFETEDGREYAAIGDLRSNIDPLRVQATAGIGEPGYAASGNVLSGEVLTMTSGPAWAPADPWVAQGLAGSVVGGGADLETIDSLISRYLERLANPPMGGNLADYVAWARAVPGVGRAFAYAGLEGANTITVIPLTESFESPFPDATLLVRVREFLDLKVPAQAGTYRIGGATPQPLDMRIALRPNTEAVRLSVRDAIDEAVARLAIPEQPDANGEFDITWISEAISLTPGEEGHTLILPAADVPVPLYNMITVGDIIFEDK